MCKLVELLKFIKEHYGYTKLYLTTPYTTLFTLSEDCPICYYDMCVMEFKYVDAHKELKVFVKEDTGNAKEKVSK